MNTKSTYSDYTIRLTIDTAKYLAASLYNFKSDIDLIQDRHIVDAKSIIGIFSLDLTKEMTLRLYGYNYEEKDKLKEIIEPVLAK